MKKWHIALIILLIALIAIPAFGQRRGRKKAVPGPKLAISLYGGAENLNGTDIVSDSSMYMGFGANLIIPLWQQFGFRLGLIKFEMPDDVNMYAFGTGVGGDVIYYFPMPMAFVPYGFGGFWYYGSSADNSSSTQMHFRGGVGGEMQMQFALFVEGGIDYQSWSTDVGGVSADDSYMPIFVHGGIRIPLFQ
jgi:hypothetical protein